VITPSFAVKRVLDDLNISSHKDLQLLDLIALERGALVQYGLLDGAEARLAVGNRKAVITISHTVTHPRRKRFSIAHELGHWEMHRWESILALCTKMDINEGRARSAKSSKEQQANQFASELLLPGQFFEPLCKEKDPSLDLVTELSDVFDVSLTATAIRYMNFCDEPCAVVFSQGGFIKWFQGSQEFEELGVFIGVRSRLDPSSLAALLFQGHVLDPNPRPRRVKASRWFASGQCRSDATIQEQSWFMPNYDAVLSLLWVDDDIDDDDWW